MAGVVVPVVVDGVQVGVALDLGGAAAGLVEVVALERDLVAGAVQVDVPVVVVVAGGRVVGLAVDVVVGEGDAVAGLRAEDVVLAADSGGLFISFESEGREGRRTVTWSTQTRSAWSMVMASPPQTYWGLMSVTAMFLCESA
jgi:hypothetical protein